jgi:hypothetical protein
MVLLMFLIATLLGLAGMVLSTLARSVWVPIVVSGGGLAALLVFVLRTIAGGCTGDAAGCGMSQGLIGISAYLCGLPLVFGGLAAIGWRIAAGRQAPMKTRLKALGLAFAALIAAILFLMTI